MATMASDNRTFGLVAAAVVLVIAAPFAWRGIRALLGPHLDGARIVSSTAADPVWRSGDRIVPPGETVELAVAVRVRRPLGGTSWIAPGAELEIDGSETPVEGDRWPAGDHQLRVFWFTIESVGVGGKLTPAEVGRGLEQRTFLAPELGRGLTADGWPETHNDDHLGLDSGTIAVTAGTVRPYARVELVVGSDDLRPAGAVTTPGPDAILAPGFTTVRRQARLADGVAPAAGELFRLPGYEPAGDSPAAREDVTLAKLGEPFTALVRQRVVASSATFAAVATAGDAGFDPATLPVATSLQWTGVDVRSGSAPARWSADLRPGDLLETGGHWLVALSDDGDGFVGPGDRVAHCWRRPPEETLLAAALGPDAAVLQVRRRGD